MVDTQENTALHKLMNVFDKNVDKSKAIFSMLAGRGAQLNRVNIALMTPLSFAVIYQHVKGVAMCLE